jgi:DNA-binding response OmpR family regulator
MAATKQQTVLVVEDEASIASFVAAYLKNAGYSVRTTASGNEALRLVASEKPALVVLDLMLPDLDGVEVCKRIRQTGDLPVLMLTARDEDVDKIIGLEVGADDYMTKPFNPRELVARVRAILPKAPSSGTATSSSTPAGVRRVSVSARSSSRRRSSICSGSCSTTAVSC